MPTPQRSLWEIFTSLHIHAKGLGYVAPENHTLWKTRARELWMELGHALGVADDYGKEGSIMAPPA